MKPLTSITLFLTTPGVGGVVLFSLAMFGVLSALFALRWILSTTPVVLIISNNPHRAAALRRFYQDNGFTPEARDDPDLWLYESRSAYPDVIVLDRIGESKQYGNTVLNLKSDYRVSDIPLLVLTDRSSTTYDCIAPSVIEFISFPADPEKIRKAVFRAVEGEATRRILIISSNKNLIDPIQSTLESLDVNIDVLHWASLFSKYLEIFEPSLIFLDFSLLDRQLVLSTARISCRLIPIIALTDKPVNRKDLMRYNRYLECTLIGAALSDRHKKEILRLTNFFVQPGQWDQRQQT